MRYSKQREEIRKVVAEEIYKQLVNGWPDNSGPVKGSPQPKDYQIQIPKK